MAGEYLSGKEERRSRLQTDKQTDRQTDTTYWLTDSNPRGEANKKEEENQLNDAKEKKKKKKKKKEVVFCTVNTWDTNSDAWMYVCMCGMHERTPHTQPSTCITL